MIKTLQTINDYQAAFNAHSKWSEDAIQDYQGLKGDINKILNAINNGDLSPQSGSGSPEGTVFANYSLLYIDLTAAPDPVIFFNPTFNEKTGWVATWVILWLDFREAEPRGCPSFFLSRVPSATTKV